MIFDYNKIPKNTKSLEVLNYKDIFEKPCADVDLSSNSLYEDMETLGWQMVKTCKEYQGIGLAAPQIGEFINMFIVVGFQKPHEWAFDRNFHMIINPTWKKAKGTDESFFPEGCLSVPNETMTIRRPRAINVEYWYFDKNKKLKKNTEPLEGFPARVFLHEFDHLLGTNIVEISAQQNKPRKRKANKK